MPDTSSWSAPAAASWPELPLHAWRDTYATLHMWTQIVGKIQWKLLPVPGNWWPTVLHVTTSGLSTGPVPFGDRTFQIDFDFAGRVLRILTGVGESRSLPLIPQSVASFYDSLMTGLNGLGIEVTIGMQPVDVPDGIRFDEDEAHHAFDAAYVDRLHLILVQIERVLNRFRGAYLGVSSPVQFFWGGFDLALTRYSGRVAPGRGGNDASGARGARATDAGGKVREEFSCGFWPGSASFEEPAFYAYTLPEPPGLREAQIQPHRAYFDMKLGEFILRYRDVRTSAQPEETVLAFLQSAYAAGAELGNWDRDRLEPHSR